MCISTATIYIPPVLRRPSFPLTTSVETNDISPAGRAGSRRPGWRRREVIVFQPEDEQDVVISSVELKISFTANGFRSFYNSFAGLYILSTPFSFIRLHRKLTLLARLPQTLFLLLQAIAALRLPTRCCSSSMASRTSGAPAIRMTAPSWPATAT